MVLGPWLAHTSRTESPVWCNASSRCRSTLVYCLGSNTYAPQKPTGRKIGDYSNNCPNHSTVWYCKHIFVLCNNNHLLTWGGFFIHSGGPLLPILIQLLWNVRSTASMGPGPKSNNEYSLTVCALYHMPQMKWVFGVFKSVIWTKCPLIMYDLYSRQESSFKLPRIISICKDTVVSGEILGIITIAVQQTCVEIFVAFW